MIVFMNGNKTTERTVTVNGHKYRQKVWYEWDKERKRSITHVVDHIGAVSPIKPRRMKAPEIERIETVVPSGHLALFHSVAIRFGLRECLDMMCPSDGGIVASSVMALVFNQLNGRRPLNRIGEWIDSSPAGRWMNASGLTKDRLLDALDTIYSRSEIAKRRVPAIQGMLTEKWEEIAGKDEVKYFVYYDVCRIRYNGSRCEWAEHGYGPDDMGRPHVGIGLVTGRNNHFPLMSMTVKGSLHDSRTLGYISTHVEGKMTMILDRAFMHEKVIEKATGSGINVLGGCMENSKEVRSALTLYPDHEIERTGQVIPRSGGVIYYRGWKGTLFGKTGTIVVTLDPMRRSEERGSRDLLIREASSVRDEKRLSELREDLGKIARTSRGRRGWKIDMGIEKGERLSDGRFLLFTTDPDLTPEEIVEAYFQRDEVEKAFREMKGSNGLGPIRYRLWNRVDAYLTVVNHMAYLIRAAIRWELRSMNRPESVDEAIDILKGIYEISMAQNGNTLRQWGPVTKKNRKLIEDLGLKDLIISY